ncbi:MAG: glycosyltransferase family 2 protein [Lachnospiraceae bacterium]|nr:glycosyltransferase family 2 protein [Lachnospiraceae bacterium]
MVTVIINCYNGEEYLQEALDSLHNQTYQDFDVVFWDNCSTDQSVAIAEQYDGNIKTYHGTEFVGLGSARNLAIQKADGDLIAFLDCDDQWERDKLEKQVRIFKENPDIDLVTTNFSIMNMESGVTKLNDWHGVSGVGGLHELIAAGSISTSACMVRKAVLQKLSFVFDTQLKYTMDFELYSRIATEKNTYFINESLVTYRIHQSMTTKKLQNVMKEEYDVLLNSIYSVHPIFAEKYPDDIRQLEFTRDFLQAKFLLSNNKKETRELLKPYFPNHRAMLLFFLALLPGKSGNRLFEFLKSKRV